MKKLLYLIILIITISIIVGCSEAGVGDDFEVWEREDPNKWVVSDPGEWTVMVWLDGDNDLEPNALYDFNEMEYGLYLQNKVIL